MSRLSIIKKTEEDFIQEAEVVMRWSKKRIVIATFLVVCIIVGGLYAILLLNENKSRVLGTVINRPQIKIPKERDIQEVIENAKNELSNINAKNVIESQPQLQKIINDLTHLTGSSSSAKNLICDAICK